MLLVINVGHLEDKSMSLRLHLKNSRSAEHREVWVVRTIARKPLSTMVFAYGESMDAYKGVRKMQEEKHQLMYRIFEVMRLSVSVFGANLRICSNHTGSPR